MKITDKQQGSSHFVAILAVGVIAIIGLIGYRVMQSSTNGTSASTLASPAAKVPANISSTADVRQASQALNATSVDSSVDPNQLDSDIQSLN